MPAPGRRLIPKKGLLPGRKAKPADRVPLELCAEFPLARRRRIAAATQPRFRPLRLRRKDRAARFRYAAERSDCRGSLQAQLALRFPALVRRRAPKANLPDLRWPEATKQATLRKEQATRGVSSRLDLRAQKAIPGAVLCGTSAAKFASNSRAPAQAARGPARF